MNTTLDELLAQNNIERIKPYHSHLGTSQEIRERRDRPKAIKIIKIDRTADFNKRKAIHELKKRLG